MNWRRDALVGAEVEHLDDVRVHEPRRGQRLAAEARDERRVLGQVLGQQLDGDVALQARVEGELDGRHAADAQAALELVAVGEELLGGHQGTVGRRGGLDGRRGLGRRRGLRGRRGRRVRGRLGRRSPSAPRSRWPSRSRSARPSPSRSRVGVGVSSARRPGSPRVIRLADLVASSRCRFVAQLRVDRARQRVDLALRVARRSRRATVRSAASQAVWILSAVAVSASALDCGISSGFDCPQPASSRRQEDEGRRRGVASTHRG